MLRARSPPRWTGPTRRCRQERLRPVARQGEAGHRGQAVPMRPRPLTEARTRCSTGQRTKTPTDPGASPSTQDRWVRRPPEIRTLSASSPNPGLTGHRWCRWHSRLPAAAAVAAAASAGVRPRAAGASVAAGAMTSVLTPSPERWLPEEVLPPFDRAWAGAGGGAAGDRGGATGATDPLYRASQAGRAWSR